LNGGGTHKPTIQTTNSHSFFFPSASPFAINLNGIEWGKKEEEKEEEKEEKKEEEEEGRREVAGRGCGYYLEKAQNTVEEVRKKRKLFWHF
jgi:hypothetical protein